MKLLYVLVVIMPSGMEYQWGKFDNIYACAGASARERLAQEWVYMKTHVNLGYKFICRRQ